MKRKRKDLRRSAQKKKIHCVLLFNLSMNPDPNFFYLTGYSGYGCLVLLRKSEHLLVPEMEDVHAKKSSKGIKVIHYRKNFWETLKRYTQPRTIGIDYGSITLSFLRVLRKQMKGRKFVDVSPILRENRAVKTRQDIKNLRKACSISDAILKRFVSGFRRFRTEKQAVAFLEQEAAKEGCSLAFPPIVASGSSAAEPHHTPDSKKIKKGFCVVDFGVRYNSICSDTTRTIYVGMPSEKDKKLYDFMLNLQSSLIRSIQPGQRCSEPYDLAVNKLGKLSKYFTHGLGHGVGFEIHELPNLKSGSKDRFRKGMAFTVEPGIYIKNRLGIRIEDTVLLGKKPIILTKIPKKLITI